MPLPYPTHVKSLQVKATKGDKCAISKGDKLQQIRCRILSQFDTGADATGFVGRMAKGMVSSENGPQIRARQPREIRLDGMLADAPLTSWHIRVEAVSVNQRRDYVSPVGVSMPCSPHPVALHVAPAARLRECCLYMLQATSAPRGLQSRPLGTPLCPSQTA